MKVRFSDRNEIFKYKSPTYPKTYTNVNLNRRVRNIERYMRKNHLLFKCEYLHLQNKLCKHIRGEHINFIAHTRRWIYKNEYLKIVS